MESVRSLGQLDDGNCSRKVMGSILSGVCSLVSYLILHFSPSYPLPISEEQCQRTGKEFDTNSASNRESIKPSLSHFLVLRHEFACSQIQKTQFESERRPQFSLCFFLQHIKQGYHCFLCHIAASHYLFQSSNCLLPKQTFNYR